MPVVEGIDEHKGLYIIINGMDASTPYPKVQRTIAALPSFAHR